MTVEQFRDLLALHEGWGEVRIQISGTHGGRDSVEIVQARVHVRNEKGRPLVLLVPESLLERKPEPDRPQIGGSNILTQPV